MGSPETLLAWLESLPVTPQGGWLRTGMVEETC